jgi:very-short-patch-repair endonuclease
VLRVGGHRLEVDFLWEDQCLVLETDGEGTHGTAAAFQRDRWREQLLVAAGYRTAGVTWEQLETELQAVVKRVGRMLDPGGQAQTNSRARRRRARANRGSRG